MRLLAAMLFWLAALPAWAQVIVDAEFTEPTTRYAHGVLGDAVEWGNLLVTVRFEKGSKIGFVTLEGDIEFNVFLKDDSVFEDTAPRLVDVDGDDKPEIIVVESHQDKGARLVVVGLTADGKVKPISWTNYIGTRNRWLAPVGVADFDGDGVKEIAFVDRPHLKRTLMVVPFSEGKLTDFIGYEGVTNHRIGDDYISGGVRHCAGRPEMILLSPNWKEIGVLHREDDQLVVSEIIPNTGRESVEAALNCE